MFEQEDIDLLKKYDEESYWFQSYHLILYTNDLMMDLENSIDKYLIPKNAKLSGREKQRQSYMKFYKENLEARNNIIRDISEVNIEVEEYLRLKIEESEATFESMEDEEYFI